MFQFTTTTILNTNIDPSGKSRFSGLVPGEFYVKGVNNFIGDNVKLASKRYAAQPVLAKATLEIDNSGGIYTPGDYQLVVQLNYQGSQNSFYATPVSYTKGKPLFFAFTVEDGDDGTIIAGKINKIARWLATRFDSKWVDISNFGEAVYIDAIDEYQRFVTVRIERFDTDPYGNAIWKTVLDAKLATDPKYDAHGTIVQGREGFGTYTQLLKDLRLPTAANTTWLALNQEERPIPGELYNQYTIQYVKKRGIMGQSAVGELSASSTTHVFYVRQSLAGAFETAALAGGTGIIFEEVVGPGSDVTLYPAPTPVVPDRPEPEPGI
jgi:hypothetical protein